MQEIRDYMTERPKCKNEKCDNGSLIYILDGFYCGDCAVKIQQNMKKEKEEIAKKYLE